MAATSYHADLPAGVSLESIATAGKINLQVTLYSLHRSPAFWLPSVSLHHIITGWQEVWKLARGQSVLSSSFATSFCNSLSLQKLIPIESCHSPLEKLGFRPPIVGRTSIEALTGNTRRNSTYDCIAVYLIYPSFIGGDRTLAWRPLSTRFIHKLQLHWRPSWSELEDALICRNRNSYLQHPSCRWLNSGFVWVRTFARNSRQEK